MLSLKFQTSRSFFFFSFLFISLSLLNDVFVKFVSIYNIYNSRTTLQIYESHHRFYIKRLFKLCYFSVYFLYFTILLYIFFYHARKTKTKNSNFQVQSIVPCTDQKSSDRSMLHGAENLAVHPPINFLLPEATRK